MTTRNLFAPLDVGILLILAFIGFVVPIAMDGGTPPGKATLFEGAVAREIPLKPSSEFALKGPLGESLFRVGDDYSVNVISAPCPNGICVGMGPVKRRGEVIVCLPNKVGIKLSGGDAEGGVDAVSR